MSVQSSRSKVGILEKPAWCKLGTLQIFRVALPGFTVEVSSGWVGSILLLWIFYLLHFHQKPFRDLKPSPNLSMVIFPDKHFWTQLADPLLIQNGLAVRYYTKVDSSSCQHPAISPNPHASVEQLGSMRLKSYANALYSFGRTSGWISGRV